MTDTLQILPDEPAPEVAPVTVAVTPVAPKPMVAMPTHIGPNELAKLAREIAQNIKERPQILQMFSLDDAQYEHITTLPFFKRALEAAVIDWEAATSTDRRIKLQSQAGLEDVLPKLVARMGKNEENLPAVVEAGKLLAKLGGIGEADRQQVAGEKFTITINLGEDAKLQVTKDLAPTISAQDGASALSHHREGESDTAALEVLPSG